ncbi:MAG: hypothetical protein D6705_11865 [Deltaproteobacteria bacterium]|nr:MAG: hypothetical protein D6705_11865 [Deltaproteobacteria bacterium]
MRTRGAKNGMPERRATGSVRKGLRALHRDVGYLLVGLTFVYGISGLAVNHIGEFDPNFVHGERRIAVPADLPERAHTEAERQQVAARVHELLDAPYPAAEILWLSDGEAEFVFEDGTAYVDLSARSIDHTWQRPRPFLRAANFLHLNRGKAAWTYVADAYAILLLFLATSGLFMLPGRHKLARKLVLVALGAAIPVAYVVFSPGAPAANAPER